MSRGLRLAMRAAAAAFGAMAVIIPSGALGSAVYSYDQLGRLTSARYDNGICIVYAYDANGNRTSQTNAVFAGIWGSAVWECSTWTAP